MKLKLPSILIISVCLLIELYCSAESINAGNDKDLGTGSPSKENGQTEFKLIKRIVGQESLEEFISPVTINVVFFMKKESQRVKSFFKILEKSADYLSIYKVQVGVFECLTGDTSNVEQCGRPKIDNFIYTYKGSKELLSLELDTMFDVNSIMSNILQLVLLREVPIIQDPVEVSKYLKKRRGKTNVIFGYMKAIGTQEHRIFMEVAYAYQDKFSFCICTDRKATIDFDISATSSEKSAIWLIQTQNMSTDDVSFNDIRFQDKLSLTSFAKFVKALTLPSVFKIPADGTEAPYVTAGMNVITLYYKGETDNGYITSLASLLTKGLQGNFGIITVDIETSPKNLFKDLKQETPALSIKYHDEASATFMDAGLGLSVDKVEEFLENVLNRRQMSDPDLAIDKEEMTKKVDLEEETEEYPEMDIEDDTVADVVYQTRKIPMKLGRVPALTDKTFPQSIQQSKMVAVLFYFPFSARNMAFLRIVGDSADMLEDSEVKVTRVNCFDWTDVCQAQNITIYPTLRFFRNERFSRDYKGPMDVKAVYSAFKLIELSMPMRLKSGNEVDIFLSGLMPKDRADISNVTVLGLFDRQHSTEKQLFEKVAEESPEGVVFALLDSAESKQVASRLKTGLPGLILSKIDDDVEPFAVFDEDFTVDNINMFIKDKKLPKLAELTALRFPDLYNRGHPFVILFTDWSDDSQLVESLLRQIVKRGQHNNLTFSYLPVPDLKSFGFSILTTYSSNPVIPCVSYVNLKQGEVYNYEGNIKEASLLTHWLESITKKDIQPSTTLTAGEWKPLNKGYDFLEIMAKERQKERQEASMKFKDKPRGSGVKPQGTAPEGETPEEDEGLRLNREQGDKDLMFDEESEAREELLELHSSRLYHHGDKSSRKAREEKIDGKMKKSSERKEKSDKHDEL